MLFSNPIFLTFVLSIASFALATPSPEEFLKGYPHVEVGRAALEAREAETADGHTYRAYDKPHANIVMIREFDADEHKLKWSVALVNDKKAEAHYKTHHSETTHGDHEKRNDCKTKPKNPGKRDMESQNEMVPREIFARASRCAQFCGRSRDCTVDARCPLCAYVGGACRWQLRCEPR